MSPTVRLNLVRIEKTLLRKFWSWYRLGQEAGISSGTITKARKTGRVSIRIAEKIGTVLEIPPDKLFVQERPR